VTPLQGHQLQRGTTTGNTGTTSASKIPPKKLTVTFHEDHTASAAAQQTLSEKTAQAQAAFLAAQKALKKAQELQEAVELSTSDVLERQAEEEAAEEAAAAATTATSPFDYAVAELEFTTPPSKRTMDLPPQPIGAPKPNPFESAASVLAAQLASATSTETAGATPPMALKDRTDSPPAQSSSQPVQSEQEDNPGSDHHQHEQDKHEESDVDDEAMRNDQQEGSHEDTQEKLQEETQETEEEETQETEEVAQPERPATVGNPTETGQEKKDASSITSGPSIDPATPYFSLLLVINKLRASAYHVPNDKCEFNRNRNTESHIDAYDLQNSDQDFETATETLVPLEQHRLNLKVLRDKVHSITQKFVKLKSHIARVDGQLGFVNTCVDIKPEFHIPHGAKSSPICDSVFKLIHNDFDTVVAGFKNLSTELITFGEKAEIHKLRCDRADAIFEHLIHKLGKYHISYFRKVHGGRAIIDPTKPKTTASKTDLAIAAVCTVISQLDLEMLEFLDFNRVQLMTHYKSKYPTILSKKEQSEMDQQAIEHTIRLILTYIKPTIYTSWKLKLQADKRQIAEAKVCAEMEADQAKTAMAATQTAIQIDTPHLPHDPKTLRDAMEYIQKKQAKADAKKVIRKAMKIARREANEPPRNEPPRKKPKRKQSNKQAGPKQPPNQQQPPSQALNPGSTDPYTFVISAQQHHKRKHPPRNNNNKRRKQHPNKR
jgi:hypothetical protein